MTTLDSDNLDLSTLSTLLLLEMLLEAIKQKGDAHECEMAIERNRGPGIISRRQVARKNLDRAETNHNWVWDEVYRRLKNAPSVAGLLNEALEMLEKPR
jgi:hypothetical protein